MQIKLKFLGAAQNVTGSRHMLEANGARILIDCGLYQERHFRERNWAPFIIPPDSINAVLLTHAHLDHCGLLPKLVKEGFKGRIYCNSATAELAKIILLDSAKIQEEDAAHKRKRHAKQGRKGPYPEAPLYTAEDAEACFPLFSPVEYRKAVPLGDGVEATFYDAGHVLGSSIIRAKVRWDGQERIILFSGDIGRPDRPIVCDPTVFDAADYVLIESTYGDRIHERTSDVKKKMGDIINSTKKAGGNIVVPSFALERSQEVLYYINELLLEKTISPLKIFLDSPMASKITKVFQSHPELFDEKMAEFIRNKKSPFNLPNLELAGKAEESKAINNIKGTVMIIAGSGMCTGGRIKYHLVNNISKPENTIMFVGYQAVGTLGRQIVDGAEKVRILGEQREVKANIVRIHGFSAHADRSELLTWLKGLKTPPRKVFIVHGETESASNFGTYLREQTGWDVSVPAYRDEVVLE
ncbi:MAG: MBL fold metallo-hydrolase [Phycisphaerae bacterium]|nr:MBL fold metallo-hydrolase [Phycisphaerae bacterium]MDD5380063.1 MBL fold metallo-hydrolase [Phycisphaerae bacterium]